MVDNYFKISNSDDLNNIFKSARDKLVILLYYSKHNKDSVIIELCTDKISNIHKTSIFCSIDIDNFRGNSRYVDKKYDVPTVQGFFMGNSLGIRAIRSEREYEDVIRGTEIYVRDQNNIKNDNLNRNNTTNYNLSPSYHTVPNIQIPTYQYPIQPYSQSPITQSGPELSSQINYLPNQINQSPSDTNFFVPSIQQMQYMFKLFRTLQKMGVLITDDDEMSTSVNKKSTDEAIVLSNGDRIVPLGDGKYGLIQN